MSETNKTVHLVGADLDLVLEQKPKRQRRTRKPRSIATMIKQAEKTGKSVSSVTTADGVTLTFGQTVENGTATTADDELATWRRKKGHANRT